MFSKKIGVAREQAGVPWFLVTLLFAAAGCGSGEVQVRDDASSTTGDASSRVDASMAGRDGAQGRRDGAVDVFRPVWDAARPDTAVAPDAATGGLVPPAGGSSGGTGGGPAPNGTTVTAGRVTFILIVPNSYSPSVPNPMMVVFSGTEGAQTMAQNLIGAGGYVGLGDLIFVVLDGVTYRGDGEAGAIAMDWVRQHYNIDNDRTYLLSESAGTTAGLELGLRLRQSYFAAYWANDVNASATPAKTAAELGFRPWGNAGPGGDFADANAIVQGMRNAGYRLPADAPYSGPGAGQHGSTDQFLAALRFFVGKSRTE